MPNLASKVCRWFPFTGRKQRCPKPVVVFVPDEALGRGRGDFYCQECFDAFIEGRVEAQEGEKVT